MSQVCLYMHELLFCLMHLLKIMSKRGKYLLISQIAVTHAKDAYAMVTSSASGRFGGRAKEAVRGYGELVSTG